MRSRTSLTSFFRNRTRSDSNLTAQAPRHRDGVSASCAEVVCLLAFETMRLVTRGSGVTVTGGGGAEESELVRAAGGRHRWSIRGDGPPGGSRARRDLALH